jgi:hypothetical protein
LAKEEAHQADQEEVEPEVTHDLDGLGMQHKEIHFGMDVITSQVDLVVKREENGMVAAAEVPEKQAGQTVG